MTSLFATLVVAVIAAGIGFHIGVKVAVRKINERLPRILRETGFVRVSPVPYGLDPKGRAVWSEHR